MKHTLSRKFVALAALLQTASFRVLAQDISSPATMINSVNQQVKETVSPVINLVIIIIGLVGIVFCIPALIKYVRGEERTSNSLTKVDIGIIIAMLIVYVIKTVVLHM